MGVNKNITAARRRAAAKKDKTPPGSRAEWEMVKLTRAIVAVAIVTAIIGVFAVVFTGLQLLSQGKQLYLAERQFSHAVKQAAGSSKDTRAALAVSDRVATATEGLVGVNRDQAAVADKALNQGRNFFTAQQRPIVDLDLERGKFDFGFDGRVFGWNYNFKNTGPSTARKLVIRESLSVYRRPLQTNVRSGQEFMGPGGVGSSTAHFMPTPEDLRSGKPRVPRIEVTFTYLDQFGNKLSSGFCRYLGEDNETIYVC